MALGWNVFISRPRILRWIPAIGAWLVGESGSRLQTRAAEWNVHKHTRWNGPHHVKDELVSNATDHAQGQGNQHVLYTAPGESEVLSC